MESGCYVDWINFNQQLTVNVLGALQESNSLNAPAFMVSTIKEAARSAEQRLQFIAKVKSAREEMIEAGKGLDTEELRAFPNAKVSGKEIAKPKAHAWCT